MQTRVSSAVCWQVAKRSAQVSDWSCGALTLAIAWKRPQSLLSFSMPSYSCGWNSAGCARCAAEMSAKLPLEDWRCHASRCAEIRCSCASDGSSFGGASMILSLLNSWHRQVSPAEESCKSCDKCVVSWYITVAFPCMTCRYMRKFYT
jgi:hypothetical protein